MSVPKFPEPAVKVVIIYPNGRMNMLADALIPKDSSFLTTTPSGCQVFTPVVFYRHHQAPDSLPPNPVATELMGGRKVAGVVFVARPAEQFAEVETLRPGGYYFLDQIPEAELENLQHIAERQRTIRSTEEAGNGW